MSVDGFFNELNDLYMAIYWDTLTTRALLQYSWAI